MKLSINHHGHLDIDLGCIWIQSNPLSSCILLGRKGRYIMLSHFQLDDCCEFTFSIEKGDDYYSFTAFLYYPMVSDNLTIFPLLKFFYKYFDLSGVF